VHHARARSDQVEVGAERAIELVSCGAVDAFAEMREIAERAGHVVTRRMLLPVAAAARQHRAARIAERKRFGQRQCRRQPFAEPLDVGIAQEPRMSSAARDARCAAEQHGKLVRRAHDG
jgi:hypothetical protein